MPWYLIDVPPDLVSTSGTSTHGGSEQVPTTAERICTALNSNDYHMNVYAHPGERVRAFQVPTKLAEDWLTENAPGDSHTYEPPTPTTSETPLCTTSGNGPSSGAIAAGSEADIGTNEADEEPWFLNELAINDPRTECGDHLKDPEAVAEFLATARETLMCGDLQAAQAAYEKAKALGSKVAKGVLEFMEPFAGRHPGVDAIGFAIEEHDRLLDGYAAEQGKDGIALD